MACAAPAGVAYSAKVRWPPPPCGPDPSSTTTSATTSPPASFTAALPLPAFTAQASLLSGFPSSTLPDNFACSHVPHLTTSHPPPFSTAINPGCASVPTLPRPQLPGWHNSGHGDHGFGAHNWHTTSNSYNYSVPPPVSPYNFTFSIPNAPTMPTAVDLRTPPPRSAVIDLTLDDSPPPAYRRERPSIPYRQNRPSFDQRSTQPREVIDLDAIPDNSERRSIPAPAPAAAPLRRDESDEVQVTFARPATQPLRHVPNPFHRLQPVEPSRMYETAAAQRDRLDLAQYQRALAELERGPPMPAQLHWAAVVGLDLQDNAELIMTGYRQPMSRQGMAGVVRRAAANVAAAVAARAAADDEVIFTKGDTPPPPRAGFTRSPREDDVLVCPNCDDELSVGDHPEKKQVWMIRACGHVYCGECALNRFKAPQQKRAKPHPPKVHRPFNACKIEGCQGKAQAPKSMLRIRF